MAGIFLFTALALAALVTSFLSGILGMAGGMILMGALLAWLPVADAMVLHGLTQLASNAWRALLWHRAIAWRCFGGYALGALAAMGVFAMCQVVLGRAMVLLCLGAAPFALWFLPRGLQLNVDRPGQPLACGVVCMGMQLLSGISGSLLDSFFLRSAMNRKQVVATKAAVQTISHAGKIAYFGALTSVGGSADPWLAATMMLCAMVGTSASRRVLERMSDAAFRDWTRRTVFAVASFYLASGLWTAAR
jgi:uncharacterized membrane protein YfcA